MRSFTLALHFDHDVLDVRAAGCLVSGLRVGSEDSAAIPGFPHSPTPEMNSSWLLCAYKTQLLTCKETVWGLNVALMAPVLPVIKQTLLSSSY